MIYITLNSLRINIIIPIFVKQTIKTNDMKLTLEIIDSYGFKKTTNKPDWDDVQNTYTLKNGIELNCLTVCCNEPTNADCLEGLDGFIYITEKEQLDDLNSKTFEQICSEIAKVNDNFDIDEYV